VTKKTSDSAHLSADFLTKYKLADKASDLKSYKINSFSQIGMVDPFPEDSKRLKGSIPDEYKLLDENSKDLVYESNRFFSSYSPN